MGRRILEVGCGLGNITPYFLGRDRLVSIDILPASVWQVERQLSREPNFRAFCADICSAATYQELKPYRFDTVVCLNVLEHIQNDALALRHMAGLLEPGGSLLLFVPAGGSSMASSTPRSCTTGATMPTRSRQLLEQAGLRVETHGT